MAQLDHRIDLKKADMSMLSSEVGRSVLVSDTKNNNTGEESNPPEILYMHNVMPTARGLQSVGFKEVIAAPTGGEATTAAYRAYFLPYVTSDVAGTIFDTDNHVYLLSLGATNTFYFNYSLSSTWIPITTPVVIGSAEPTVAIVVGGSYILVDTNKVYTFAAPVVDLKLQAFIGSPLISIRGILGAFGYLIAWGSNTAASTRDTSIAWSSLLNPLDLTPSAVTGAGTAKVEGASGPILFCKVNSTGFLVYCANNVVAAIYTGNKQYPFKFVPIEGAKGLGDSSTDNTFGAFGAIQGLVAGGEDDYDHFSLGGTGGLQIVNSKKASSILPEFTDFITGKLIEDYDEATDLFSLTEIAAAGQMLKQLRYIAARYLVISYGKAEYTHALIYDVVLKRLGKIKFTHVDVFEHKYSRTYLAPYTNRELAKESIAFIDNTGLTSLVSFNPVDVTRTGVLILGKYQYTRNRFLTLQKVTCENVDAADSFEFIDRLSLDGRNVSSQVAGTETSGVGYREFSLLASGRNHSLAFIGEFILNTIELMFSIGGKR